MRSGQSPAISAGNLVYAQPGPHAKISRFSHSQTLPSLRAFTDTDVFFALSILYMY